MTVSLTKSLLTLALIAGFCHDAVASDKQKKSEKPTDVSSAIVSSSDSSKKIDYTQPSLSSESDVQRSYELTGESSLSKLEKIAIERDSSKKKARLEAIETDDQLEQKGFLLNNVPPEIRILGEKAVKNYLQTHFVDKKDAKPVEQKTTEVIWKSDPATLTPITPAVVAPTTNNATQNQQGTITPSTQAPASLNNEKALAALGLTADELKATASPEKPKTNTKEKPKNTSSHSVGDIKWNRVVIMGKVARADLTVELVTNDGKKVPHSISGIEAGSYFNIAEREYRVDSITSDAVVFTDVKSNKSHRVPVR